jgi:anti-sigma factor RsiW
MIDTTLMGPCADYEHDLVDLHDGALAPERARIVRLHVEQCTRCRAWQAEFAALDARLARELPQVALSAEFDARLHERLAGLTRQNGRAERRSMAEREHDSLVEALRRAARRNALSGAVGTATAVACALLVARDLLRESAGMLASVPGGSEPWLVFGIAGIAVAIGGLAWSAARNGLPLPG